MGLRIRWCGDASRIDGLGPEAEIVAAMKKFMRRRYATARAQLDNPGPKPAVAQGQRGPGGARQRLNQRPQPGPPSADDPSDLRLVERRDGAIRLAGKDNATGEAACIVQRCGGAECDDFENVVGRSGQDITEATDTNVESGTVYRYRVYALKPTPQGPRGTGVSNVVTVGAEASR